MTVNAPDAAREPLKILITADAVGGVWQYTVDLISGLVARGAQVLVATMGRRPAPEQKQQLLELPNVTFAESEYALEWMPGAWKDVDAAGEWLLDLDAAFDADVIHLNGYSHANLPWRKPVVVVGHSCVYSWSRAVRGGAPDAEWAEYKRRVTRGLRACNRVVAPSAAMATALREEYGVSADKLRVIHNFSRNPPFSGSKEPLILGAGRIWDPAKNLQLLHQIAARLDWQIRLAGDGKDAAPGDSIHWLGVLPHAELMKQMDRAAIFAHPALYEPFGLSVLEAARARCCLVLSDIPSLRELWDGAAVFLDPRGADRWAIELNQLSRDLEKIQSLGLRAQSHAARYNEPATIGQYLEIYDTLAASAARSKTRGAA